MSTTAMRLAPRALLLIAATNVAACKRVRTLSDFVDKGSAAVRAEVRANRHPVDEVDREGFTALHRATERGNVDAMSTLLALHSEIDKKDGRGRSALFIASQLGNIQEVYVLLAAGADPGSVDAPVGMRPLHAAVAARSAHTVDMLLDAGADVNGVDQWGQGALHVASRSDWIAGHEMIDLLLRRGARTDVPDENGFTPLHAAAAHDNVPAIRALVSHGADIDARTKLGRTSLDVALGLRCDLAAELLFSLGSAQALPEAPPLHQAAGTDDRGWALFLLSYGVEANLRYAGETALDVARRQHSTKVIELLEQWQRRHAASPRQRASQ